MISVVSYLRSDRNATPPPHNPLSPRGNGLGRGGRCSLIPHHQEVLDKLNRPRKRCLNDVLTDLRPREPRIAECAIARLLVEADRNLQRILLIGVRVAALARDHFAGSELVLAYQLRA